MNQTVKKNFVLLGILLTVTLAGFGFTAVTGGFEKAEIKDDKFRIVTSFYPVYIAALNITDGLEDVEVTNMTENAGGCLHDYQLTAADMKKLEHADVFVINGAGMELFMESIEKAYPELTVIDTSKGITLLEAAEHVHGAEEEAAFHQEDIHIHEEEEIEEEYNHGAENGHIWMNPDNYIVQIHTMSEGLGKLDKKNHKAYEENAYRYIEKIEAVGNELELVREGHAEEPIVIFHDSYAYLAEKLHFHIVHQVVIEEDTSMSAGEIAEIMEEIRAHDVSVLLAEKQFSEQIPTRIAEETGTKVVIVDSLVSGPMDKDAYINGMMENIRILKEELK